MQYFYINQNSELPYLRMELVNDGKYEFLKSGKSSTGGKNAIQTRKGNFPDSSRLILKVTSTKKAQHTLTAY